jgi:hypothetical protein
LIDVQEGSLRGMRGEDMSSLRARCWRVGVFAVAAGCLYGFLAWQGWGGSARLLGLQWFLPSALVIVAGMSGLFELRDRRRRMKNREADPRKAAAELEVRCLKCGYILRGLEIPRCPECGTLRGFKVSMEQMGITESELRSLAEGRKKVDPAADPEKG